MIGTMRRLVFLPLLFLAACASGAGRAPAPEASAVAAVRLPNDVHWVRSSAEYRAILLQTYGLAGERLREIVAGREAGSWAVVLDADETVLDNSLFQKRLAESGAAYSEEIWNDWVREEAAPALPGAVEFIRLARSLGGRVVIVTNREMSVCEPTRRNLVAVGIEADAVLCKGETSNKNPRFVAVAEGTAAPGLPPLEIVMYVGDNVQDFPGQTQSSLLDAQGSAYGAFGRTWFILPNPMYGSWERNPVR